MLLLQMAHNNITSRQHLAIGNIDLIALIKLLLSKRVDTFVCGGISRDNKKYAESEGIEVIDNVACSEDEICEALMENKLRPGYGFISTSKAILDLSKKGKDRPPATDFNCLRCITKECEKGESCPSIEGINVPPETLVQSRMHDAALDIAMEEERKLCRLSEVIYYALDMKYRTIGVAYCTELGEPTEILVSVLRRFFDVVPVCCKVMGRCLGEGKPGDNGTIACNPLAQAEVLNNIGTDFNIMAGLCVGSDSLFIKASDAPTTALFVKDKSLANNPIGALYSDYYLKEVEESVNH
jgi:uncharacterized metal-binding protein